MEGAIWRAGQDGFIMLMQSAAEGEGALSGAHAVLGIRTARASAIYYTRAPECPYFFFFSYLLASILSGLHLAIYSLLGPSSKGPRQAARPS